MGPCSSAACMFQYLEKWVPPTLSSLPPMLSKKVRGDQICEVGSYDFCFWPWFQGGTGNPIRYSQPIKSFLLVRFLGAAEAAYTTRSKDRPQNWRRNPTDPWFIYQWYSRSWVIRMLSPRVAWCWFGLVWINRHCKCESLSTQSLGAKIARNQY